MSVRSTCEAYFQKTCHLEGKGSWGSRLGHQSESSATSGCNRCFRFSFSQQNLAEEPNLFQRLETSDGAQHQEPLGKVWLGPRKSQVGLSWTVLRWSLDFVGSLRSLRTAGPPPWLSPHLSSAGDACVAGTAARALCAGIARAGTWAQSGC